MIQSYIAKRLQEWAKRYRNDAWSEEEMMRVVIVCLKNMLWEIIYFIICVSIVNIIWIIDLQFILEEIEKFVSQECGLTLDLWRKDMIITVLPFAKLTLFYCMARRLINHYTIPNNHGKKTL